MARREWKYCACGNPVEVLPGLEAKPIEVICQTCWLKEARKRRERERRENDPQLLFPPKEQTE